MANKTADAIKLVLRLPKAVHRRLKFEAARHDVSLNTEIVQRLKESLPTAQTYRGVRALSDRMISQGVTKHILTGEPLTELNAKLDKLIAAVEALERDEGQAADRRRDAKETKAKKGPT
jgi:plasmid stability protein